MFFTYLSSSQPAAILSTRIPSLSLRLLCAISKSAISYNFSPSRNLLSLSSPPGFCTSIHTPSRLKSPRFTTSVLRAISKFLSLSLFNVSRETIQQQLRIIMAWHLRPWCRILHNALLKTRSNCHT